MPRRSPAACSFVLALFTAACAGDGAAGDYPSLARRPTEGRGFAEPVLPPAPPAVADPRLDGAIAGLRARMAAVVMGFDRTAGEAERAGATARGRAIGSEAWLSAQSALAGLDDWRAQLSALASETDGLAAARTTDPAGPYAPLTALTEALRIEAERQNTVLARIQALTPAA